MPRERKEKRIKNIKLKQPDRSGPTEKTLFELAQERQLFNQALERERELKKSRRAEKKDGAADEDDDDEEAPTLPPGAERFLEAMLWTTTLAMLHFTFDVFVQHQYGTSVKWHRVCSRTGTAWLLFLFLFYPLHPHESNPILIPGIPKKYQHYIRQTIFFVMSVACGCYLIYITNMFSYLKVMKRAPPLACLWLWSVFEMDLVWGATSLLIAAGFTYFGGYEIH